MDIIKILEPRETELLEMVFDMNGFVLLQKLTKIQNKEDIDLKIKETLHKEKISKISKKEYSEVKITKNCPNCNESALELYVEAFASNGKVPVVPTYHCKNCKGKSYYLTDSYLEYLVNENKGLFSDAELIELEKDRNAFMNEIKAYIIRIFASKKILNIK
ncbi:MAG: hypothetical protein ABR981_04140 [Candidatus Micrarchaeaceae archaeon]|jgi:transposase-like protein